MGHPSGMPLPLVGLTRSVGAAHDAFLGRGGDQYTVPVVELSAYITARSRGGGAFYGIQQPIIKLERPMKPHGVINGGDVHAGFEKADAYRFKVESRMEPDQLTAARQAVQGLLEQYKLLN